MMCRSALRALGLLVILVPFLVSCSSSDGDPTDPGTGGTPTRIDDFAITGGSEGALNLAWTAPQLENKATLEYELRYASLRLAHEGVEDWLLAEAPPGREPGQSQFYTMGDLDADSTYALTLRASAGGYPGPWSPIRVGTAATDVDQTPPAAIDDLQFWNSTATTLTLTWGKSGDDGIFGEASSYMVRYSSDPIDEENWDDSTLFTGDIVAATNPDRLQVTIEDLTEDATYHVAVCAFDEQNQRSTAGMNLVAEATPRRTWYVKDDGSGDVATIEEALESVSPGDIILVAPGHYTWTNQDPDEPFYGLIFIYNFLSDFTLMSEEGPEATILDAEGQGNVIWVFGNNENVIIDGFTVTGGLVDGEPGTEDPRYAGGGIVVHLASPLIRNCIITGNQAVEGGGVWFGSTGEPRLVDCIVENNTANIGGGVSFINDSERMEITGCLIRNNHAYVAGGGFFDANALFTMSDCVITGNTSGNKGGGISVTLLHPDTHVINTTIIGNTGSLGAGIRLAEDSILNLDGCIIAQNEGPAFSTITGGGITMGCSVVWGNTGGDDLPNIFTDLGGNFSLDPRICNPTTGTLVDDSPCLPGNHPDEEDCGTIGAGAVGCYR